MFPFSGLPAAFRTDHKGSLEVARHEGDTFTYGSRSGSSWVKVVIKVSAIFPADPKQTQILEEGYRQKGTVVVYSPSKLVAGALESAPSSSTRGDVFAWNGELYQIVRVNDWHGAAGFYEAFAVKMDRPAASVDAFIALEMAS